MTPDGLIEAQDVRAVKEEYVCAEPLQVMNTSIPNAEELRIVSSNARYWSDERSSRYWMDCYDKCSSCCLCTCSCIVVLFIIFAFIMLILACIKDIEMHK